MRPGPDLIRSLENPSTYVCARHLSELRPGVIRGAYQAELDRCSEATGLTACAVSILALGSLLPRPNGRPDGVGMQVSAAFLARVTGYSPRMVGYGLAELTATEICGDGSVRQLAKRFRRLVPVDPWTDDDNQLHHNVDTPAVLYLTPAGVELLAPFGFQSVPLPGHGRIRGRRGLLGFLLGKLGGIFRTWIRRVASSRSHCIPSKTLPCRNHHSSLYIERETAVGKGPAPPRHARTPPIATNAAACGLDGEKSKKQPVTDFDRVVHFCVTATVTRRVRGDLVRVPSPITHVRDYLPPGMYDAHPSHQAEYRAWFAPYRRAITAELERQGFRP